MKEQVPRSDPKDRFRKDLRALDPESPEYWDEILRREGLSMSAGSDRRLTYHGDSQDIARIEDSRQNESSGKRVHPKGAKPE